MNLPETRELRNAVKHKDHLQIQQLLESGTNCNLRDLPRSQSSAHISMAMQALFRPRSNGGSEPTLLMRAIENHDTDTVRLLLDHGANPNATAQSNAGTPLIWAASCTPEEGEEPNDKRMITMLLDHGASIDYRDKKGETALMWAVLAESDQNVRALLARGANPKLVNSHNQTALELAEEISADECIKALKVISSR